MANIVYSVLGNGWGHVIRSEVVIKHLESQGHKVFVAADGKAFDYFKTKFNQVFPLKGTYYTFKNSGSLNKTKLTYDLIIGLPRHTTYNLKSFLKNLFPLKPDLIITDFEPTAQVIAFLLDIPFISIDNVHALLCPGVSVPGKHKSDFNQAKLITKNVARGADHYFVCSWDKNLKESLKFSLVPPILRQEIIETKASNKKHILVYQWAEFIDKTTKVLTKFPDQKFIVYGSNKDLKLKNIEFKSFSDSSIINDIASSQAVINSGGFTGCSEALYFGKPILVVPQGGQFEQRYNGLTIESSGYGKVVEKLSSKFLEEFLEEIPGFNKNLRKYQKTDNSLFFAKLDQIINKLIN